MKKTYSFFQVLFLAFVLICAPAKGQYCTTGLGGGYCYDYITNVSILTTPLNNTTNCFTTGAGDSYTSYSMSPTTTATLVTGLSYSISVTTNFGQIESLWIDYDQDGLFEPSEWFQITLNSPPAIANISTFLVPLSATTGTTGMRVRTRGTGNQNGANDACSYFGTGETEDYVITIINGSPCTAAPAANTVVASQTTICPVFGTAILAGTITYTQTGISYQWQQSTAGAIGPYTAIPSATLSGYSTPTLSGTTWYRVTANCISGGVTMTATPVQINVAPVTVNTVPYFESFEGITNNKDLPNCSWFRNDTYQCGSRTTSVNAWRQARTGTKFAEFDASNNVYGQTRYFYSNGIILNVGVTYSASVWYANQGAVSWNNLALMYGPNQSPVGLISLAGISSPNTSVYTPLSNTFQVATSNTYFLAVRATEAGYASQLVWDDLSVTIPCQLPVNAANITLVGSTTVCAGQPLSISASGAGTYSWSTNANGNSISVNPLFSTTYSVTGTNAVTGCLGSATRVITVNQLPAVSIVSMQQAVCDGSPVTLIATGANSYTWSSGPTIGSVLNITPTTANNTFTVLGKDVLGCTNSAIKTIVVNPLPTVSVSGNTLICVGASANLTASGSTANISFEWIANNLYLQSNPVSISPMVSTVYTVTATDANNCEGSTMVTVAVDPCVGITTTSAGLSSVSVYPNPTDGFLTVATGDKLVKSMELVDVTGRIILTVDGNTQLNITTLSNGIYYLKITTENTLEIVKVVKQ